MKRKPNGVYMWTWEIQDDRGRWVLCRFAEATRELLVANEKPSNEARPVRIYCQRSARKAK